MSVPANSRPESKIKKANVENIFLESVENIVKNVEKLFGFS
jgi:hypothetical protein